MSRALELADEFVNASTISSEDGLAMMDSIVSELRRIPELERQLADAQKRALTEAELVHIEQVSKWLSVNHVISKGSNGHYWLSDIVNRLRPQPIQWTDVGDGAIAAFGGWTLVVFPDMSCVTDLPKACWYAVRHGRRANVGCTVESLDAAKAAAEAWARKQTS